MSSQFGYSKNELASGSESGTGNNQAPQEQQAGFFTRVFIHVIGAIAGALAIFLGFFSMITISGLCILAGLYMMLIGFIVILLEAPICCKFMEFTDKIGQWSNTLSPVIKAAFYLLSPVVSFFLCRGISQIFCCLLIMSVGVLYGLVFIGKKGDAVKQARMNHLQGGAPDQVSMSTVQQQPPPAYSAEDRYP